MSTLGFKVQKMLSKFGIGITSYSELSRLQLLEDNQAQYDIKFLPYFDQITTGKLVHLLQDSQSQLRQDLFVLCATNFKTQGYFVEFGAANGRNLSNSYLLESQFNWTGILAEPAKTWHDSIIKNRPNVHFEKKCVWSESNSKLKFRETANAELSTLQDYIADDEHSKARQSGVDYEVDTISLNDLLVKYGAPTHIDYLSIDTEGSEYQILKNLDFSKYSFTVITCEHNYGINRRMIFDLLSSHGYVRVMEEISDFDDWFVHESKLAPFQDLLKVSNDTIDN